MTHPRPDTMRTAFPCTACPPWQLPRRATRSAAAASTDAVPWWPQAWQRGLWAAATGLVLGVAMLPLQAAPVEVPDPKGWAQLSPEDQAQRREALKRQLVQATPAERQAFRQALRERLQALSPQDRQALAAQTRLSWDAMTPEQRQRLVAERRAQVQAMSPEQRRELLQQRQAMLDKLSPEERRALRQKLPTD